MAVYKATLCYPFLNSLDIRIVADQDDNSPTQWLKCKIDSSNKEITGYRIKILDENNKQIFPANNLGGFISPLSELTNLAGLDDGVNTGYNGTYIHVPFFQNFTDKKLASYNAVYFSANYKADYIISTNSGFDGNNNAANWEYNYYPEDDIEFLSLPGWDGSINNELAVEDEIIFVQYEHFVQNRRSTFTPNFFYERVGSAPNYTYNVLNIKPQNWDINYFNYFICVGGLWQVQPNGKLMRYTDYFGSEIGWPLLSNKTVFLSKGKWHNHTYDQNSESSYYWEDVNGTKIDFSINEGSYKWVIEMFQGREQYKEDASSLEHQYIVLNTTYQLSQGSKYYLNYKNTNYYKFTYTGPTMSTAEKLYFNIDEYDVNNLKIFIYNADGEIFNAPVSVSSTVPDDYTSLNNDSNDAFFIKSMDYTKLDNTWFDMTLTTGTILGSTNKRLQIADINNNYKIPEGTSTDPLVLQGKYVALLNDHYDALDGINRAYVQTYDATYGHIYPTSDSLTSIQNATKVAFYKYSNDPSAILAGDRVQVATDVDDEEVVSASGTYIYQHGNIFGLFSDFAAKSIECLNLVNELISKTDTTYTIKLDENRGLNGVTINGPNHIILTCYNGSYDIIRTNNMPVSVTGGYTITAELYSSMSYSVDDYYKITSGNDAGKVYHQGSGATLVYIPDTPAPGLFKMGGIDLQEGDYVLVKNQTEPKENGVFIAHAAGTNNTRWTRAGSYDQWSDFIGKIIYVSGGKNQGRNFQSLATAGGSLYRAENLSSNNGSTLLLFVEEKPILLYPNSLKTTVMAAGTPVISAGTINRELDQYELKNNDTLFKIDTREVYEVTAVNDSTATIILKETLNTSDYIYVSNGQTYGANVLTYSSTSSSFVINKFALRSADILKNTFNQTYISPYIGMQSGMALKLNNGMKFNYMDGSSSQYMTITNVNNNVWYINHKQLLSPLCSDNTQEGSPYKYDIRSYFRSSDENPFVTYETPYLKLGNLSSGYTNIWTYTTLDVSLGAANNFEEYFIDYNGDYNSGDGHLTPDTVLGESSITWGIRDPQHTPMVSATVYVDNEAGAVDWAKIVDYSPTDPTHHPGLIIDSYRVRAGDIVMQQSDSTFHMAMNTSPYHIQITNADYSQDHFYYICKGSTHGGTIIKNHMTVTKLSDIVNYQIPYLVGSSPLTTITNRYITLQGYYYQYQQLSWESYRWVLVDYNGTIVQDTGKKYDKQMKVSFYGLSNESENNQNIYYAILYVEDSVGNILDFTVRLVVDPSSGNAAGIPFNATFDCSTHSMKLTYQDNSLVYPSYNNYLDKNVDEAYIIENPNISQGTLQGGESWDNSVEYDDWQTDKVVSILGKDGDDSVSENRDLSYTERYGLQYKHYFPDNSLIINKNSNYLAIQDDKATIATEIIPSDSYAGNLFNITCNGEESYQKNNLQFVIPQPFIEDNPNSNTLGSYTEGSDIIFAIYLNQSIINDQPIDKLYYLSYYIEGYNETTIRNFDPTVDVKKQYYKFKIKANTTINAGDILYIHNFQTQPAESSNMYIEARNQYNQILKYWDGIENTVICSTDFGTAENSFIVANNKNPRYNCLYFTLQCSETDDNNSYLIGSYLKTVGNQNWTWNDGGYRDIYYMQSEDTNISVTDAALDFSIEGAHTWYKSVNDETIKLNSRYPLGNLCLVESRWNLETYISKSSIYWVEDRGTLKYIVNSNYILNSMNGINLTISSPNNTIVENIPYWPVKGTEEQNSYWVEGVTNIPGTWENVVDQTGQINNSSTYSIDRWLTYRKLQNAFHEDSSEGTIFKKLRFIVRYPGIYNMFSAVRSNDNIGVGYDEDNGVGYTKIYNSSGQGTPTLFTIECEKIDYEKEVN